MSAPAVLAHQMDGEGEPLVLLNGGMMTTAAWEPMAAPLARRFRVIRCDFRGQLLSPGPAHRALAGNVDDVVHLLDELGVERAHVLGASFGAEVGLLLAALHPDRLRSLVAVTATDRADEHLRRGAEELRGVVADALAGGDRGRFHDLLISQVYAPEHLAAHRAEFEARRARLDALPESWFAGLDGILAATESFDLRPHLGAIRCPTLVVVAGGDRVMPEERSRALAAAIPGARLEVHPTSGHALVAEHPEWLVERCLAFLTEVGEVP